MIPLRVSLTGFLSYREAQEFLFDGAPLWVIVGPNGAGKSALFDAILFALYGAHRGGHENPRALINHQCDTLQVEFDFALGARVYRAKRIVSKKGKATLGIFDPAADPERAVGETDKESGFKKWIADEIGLDEKTFTASVLLQQGKTEALLNADPKARHQILSQLVDISAYARLAEKADARQKHFGGQADGHTVALNRLARVEPREIAELMDSIQEANDELETLRARLEELARLQVHAARWETLQREKENLERALAQAQDLYTRAETIERAAARWEELNNVVPRLEKIFVTRTHLEAARTQVSAHERAAQQARKELTFANGELENARAEFNSLSQQQQDAQKLIGAAQQILLALGDDIRNLKELGDKRADIENVETELKKYSETLDDEHTSLQQEINALDELRVSLPHLRAFVNARTVWNAEIEKLPLTQEAVERWQKEFSRVTGEKAEWETQLAPLASNTTEWNNNWIAARTLQDEARNALNRFGQIEHTPKCNYCGQTLTPEHRTQERERLNQALLDSENDVKQTRETHQRALAQANACAQEIETRNDALKKIEKQIGEANRALEKIQADMQHAQDEAERALHSLPVEALAAFPFSDGDVTILFQKAYPTDSEIAEWETRVKKYPTYKKRLATMESEIRARQKLETRRDLAQVRVEELENDYSEQRTDEIRAQEQQANADLKAGNAVLLQVDTPLRAAEKTRGNLETRVKNLENQEHDALGKAQTEQARGQELERTLITQLDDLTSEWRAAAQEIGESELEDLRAEQQAFEPAIAERDALRTAREKHDERKAHMREVEQESENLPAEAKRPRAELEGKSHTTRQAIGQVEALRDKSTEQKMALEHRRDQRAELETKQATARKQEHLYKELARLLGREHLQRYLLQEAEKEIVKHANQILDRISSGTLRLELRPQPARRTKAKTTVRGVKALELLAYNSATGQSAQPVDFLSGSQRFRAAVSLALGIGQWSRRGARAHDAVIIDEGFGSLDKQGRREMIEQLHALTDVLGRIILVSHQEEFAGAFANRYFVELSDQASCVRLDEEE